MQKNKKRCVLKRQLLKCIRCGREGEDVAEVLDPYPQDVENKEIAVTLCDNCYSERADDI
jgi:hypothetical protein